MFDINFIINLFSSREHKINRLLYKIEEIEILISHTQHTINLTKSLEKSENINLKDYIKFKENNIKDYLSKIERLKDELKIIVKK
ncbi:MAG: hypothetical protein WC996_03120 [Peptostreptococcales bacterium]